MTALDFSKAKDAELAWIDGLVDVTSSKTDIDEEMYEDEEMEDSTKSKLQSTLDISEVVGTIFNKFKLPEVQINLHFG